MVEEREFEEKERELPDKKFDRKREENENKRRIRELEEASIRLGRPPLLSRGGGLQDEPQNRLIKETLKNLQEEIGEMKSYLKEILEILREKEK